MPSLKAMRRKLFLLGLVKIPMIGFTKPKLIELNDSAAKVRIRLRRRTKNHLNSMYFGALAVGADLCSGLHVFYFAESTEKKMSFVFKAIEGEFLKRADSDVIFESLEGSKVKALMDAAIKSGDRHEERVEVLAKNKSDELVAKFQMTISVKFK